MTKPSSEWPVLKWPALAGFEVAGDILSPEDYTSFFQKVKDEAIRGWKSGLMQELMS